MSEIKGQLLGILLVLVVFGAVSATLAGVFTKTANQISEKSENAAEIEVDEDGPQTQGLLHY